MNTSHTTTESPHSSHVRLGITLKLFFVIITVCLIMAIGMGVANRLSFDTGFLDYLDEQEEARLTALAEVLAEEYAQKANWNFLANNNKAWRKLVTRHFRQEVVPKKSIEPPDEAERARRSWQSAHLRSSLGLIDKDNKTLIAGVHPSDNAIRKPILLESETIGWLTREPLTNATDFIDVQFQQKQTNANWLIAMFSLLLAIVVSSYITKIFLAPIRQLAEVTNRLAEGDLTARAQVNTGDELNVLSNQLNQLAATLQHNEHARRTFMAEISHDLRTPLAILRGEIEALEDGVRPFSATSLASLKAEVTMLTRLVNDIHALALADVGALAYEKSKINLIESLNTTIAAFNERFSQKNITVEQTIPTHAIYLYADAGRLSQAVHNLLENSLRYTDENGIVQVICREETESVYLDILDSAPGVSNEQLDQLFERFRTADKARNRETSGSGLGLAICRSIVEAHNGTIQAFPSPLGGLWIRIMLPFYSHDVDNE